MIIVNPSAPIVKALKLSFDELSDLIVCEDARFSSITARKEGTFEVVNSDYSKDYHEKERNDYQVDNVRD